MGFWHLPRHDYYESDPFPKTAFDKERDVQDTIFVSSNPISQHLPDHRTSDGGMHDLVQPFPLVLVIEDDAPKLLAV